MIWFTLIAVNLAMLSFFVILGYFWGRPWEKYRTEHIVPLEEEISTLERELAEIDFDYAKVEQNAALFDRDFDSEIQIQKTKIDNAYEELNSIKASKSEIYKDINTTKARLKKWHHQAQGGFFGSHKKNIPQDSVAGWFGLEQTVAHKESLQRQRSHLSAKIGSLNEKNSEIYNEQIKPAKDKRSAIYESKKLLKRLRGNGKNKQFYLQEMKALDIKRRQLDGKKTELRDQINLLTYKFEAR